jgi:CrcB protein
VSSGAALGAPLRHLTDQAVQRRYYSASPWGAFTVNVAGPALLVFVAAMPAHTGVTAAAGAGFCGTLATFSTFGYETIRMAEDGARLAAVLNAAASVITALGAAYCGMALAHPITA